MNKALLIALTLAASINAAAYAQENVQSVKISQPTTQDLGDKQCNPAGGASNSSSNSSSGGMGGVSPHTTNILQTGGHGGSSGAGNHSNFNGAGIGFGQGDNWKSPPGLNGIGSGGAQGPNAGNSNNNNGNNNSKNNNNNNGKGSSNNNSSGGGGNVISGGTATACPASTMQAFIDAFPETKCISDSSFGGMMIHSPASGGQAGRLMNPTTAFSLATVSWPNIVPGGAAMLPTTSVGASNNIPAAIRGDGTGPVTPTQMAAIASAAASFAASAPMMPDSRLQSTKEEQNAITQQQADNAADMEKQQAGCAIDYIRTALENFTVDPGNKWNKLRNELFMPIAILLLLPGAVAAQVKSIVAAGLPLWDSTGITPLDGIFRSIIAIFLIPGTYLIVNYGIDVSNSIAYTIQSEYDRIFNNDMYREAHCAHIRAFGSRLPNENLGYIPNNTAQMASQAASAAQSAPGSSARESFEKGNVDVKLEDPCAGVYNAPADKANEAVPYVVNAQRAAYNGAGAAMATTWNILCAFQMCYLYYLWFVGPIMAALWVYPVAQLRSAFPNWCEGVLTLCFWSLFWNTVIMLMACFRGIDDTGTVVMEALNFLATACVKYAFDFAGLVKAVGSQAAQMAQQGGGGGSSGGGSKSSGGGASRGSGSSSGSGSGSGSNTPGRHAPQHGPGNTSPAPHPGTPGSPATPMAAFTPVGGAPRHGQTTAQVAPIGRPPSIQPAGLIGPAGGTSGAAVSPGNPGVILPGGIALSTNNSLPLLPLVAAGAPPALAGLASLMLPTAGMPVIPPPSVGTAGGGNDTTIQQLQQQQSQQQQQQLQANMLNQGQTQQQLAQQQQQDQLMAFLTGQAPIPGLALGADPSSPLVGPSMGVPLQPANASIADPALVSLVGPQIAPLLAPDLPQPTNPYPGADPNLFLRTATPDTSALSMYNPNTSAADLDVRRFVADASALPNMAMPIPEGQTNAISYFARQGYDQDQASPMSVAMAGSVDQTRIIDPVADPTRVIDLPDQNNRVFVDGGVIQSPDSSTLPRQATYDAGSSDSILSSSSQVVDSGVNMSSSYGHSNDVTQHLPGSFGNSDTSVISTSETGGPQYFAVYQQKQNNVIEEQQQRRTMPAAKPSSNELRQPLAEIESRYRQNQLNRMAAAPPEAGKKTGEIGKPIQKPTNETEKTAKSSLADQIKYQNIRNKQRKVEDMSEEELEAMRKLAENPGDDSSI